MPTKIVKGPVEVGNRLEQLGVSKGKVIEVIGWSAPALTARQTTLQALTVGHPIGWGPADFVKSS
jgi:hypothetical protein